MRRYIRINIALTSIYIICIICICHADMASYEYEPQSGTVYPINNDNIQMVSEEVVFSNNQFIATFVFLNTTDKQQNVLMGFPVMIDSDLIEYFDYEHLAFNRNHDYRSEINKADMKHADEEDSIYSRYFNDLIDDSMYFYNFEIFRGTEDFYFEGERISSLTDTEKQKHILIKVKEYYNYFILKDGQEVSAELVSVSTNYAKEGYKYVFTTKIIFEPKEKLVINVMYNQEPIRISYNFDVNEIQYVFRTGAMWNTNINKAHFVFHLKKNNNGYVSRDYIANDGNLSLNKFMYYSKPTYSRIFETDNSVEIHLDFEDIEPRENIIVAWGLIPTGISVDDFDSDIIGYIEGNTLFSDFENKYKKQLDLFQDKKIFHSYILYLAEKRLNESKCKEKYRIERNYNLKFIINSFMALHHATLKNPIWYEFYKLFKWYKPSKYSSDFNDSERTIRDDLIYLWYKENPEMKFDW